MYDLVFGYEAGDPQRPAFSAGVGLGLATRMLFDFKGGVFWRMQAGMGEVVFAPMYQALSRRGVEFRFFHRLDEVRLADGGDAVGEIVLGVQAGRASDTARYQPLVVVKGLPCWPDRPDHSQIDIPDAGDLESHHAPRVDSGTVVLRADADFDVAVLAVSAGMIPHVCPEIVATNPRWAAMVDRLGTVATQSFQVWLDSDEDQLGWPRTSRGDAERVRRPVRHVGIDGAPAPQGTVGAGGRTRRPRLLLRVDGRAAGHRRRPRRP